MFLDNLNGMVWKKLSRVYAIKVGYHTCRIAKMLTLSIYFIFNQSAGFLAFFTIRGEKVGNHLHYTNLQYSQLKCSKSAVRFVFNVWRYRLTFDVASTIF